MPEAQKLPVKMIANRDFVNDSMYGTGRWERDEIKLVDPDTLKKMIRHVDVYQQVTAEEAAESKASEVETVVKKTEDDQNDAATQELRDSVSRMTRDAAIEYAAVHYGLKIPGNVSVEKARETLIQHIDLAGPK